MADAPRKLQPDDLVHEIRSLTEPEFTRRWIDTAILLVRLDDSAPELCQWLTATSTSKGVPLVGTRDGIGFATDMSTLPKMAAALGAQRLLPPLTIRAIGAELEWVSYFIAPLRKRGSEGKPFTDRISVGRARNNDIVLRHASVSKFHAWFECDYDDVLYLNDAKSTNHTAVGGLLLEPGESRQVDSGTEVKFGDVACVVCSPAMIWELVKKY